MDSRTVTLRRQISLLIWFFVVSLALSGFTAIPARAGVGMLLSITPASWKVVNEYLVYVNDSLWSCKEILFYGYDWLAFAHLMFAILFLGVAVNPVRNIWVVEFGMIACLLIIPFAFVMGHIRGIPLWWRLIDCAFGVFGVVPLWVVRRKIVELQNLIEEEGHNAIF